MSSEPLLDKSNFKSFENPIDSINSTIEKLEQGIKPQFFLEGHKGAIRCISISGDLMATGSADKSISVWELSSRRLLGSLTGHQNWVLSLSFSLDNKQLISGSGDGTVKFWDPFSFTELHSQKAHAGTVACLAVTEKYAVTGSSDKSAKLWDLDSKSEVFTFVGHSEPVYCLGATQDGKTLFTGSRDYTIKVWSIVHQSLLYTLTGHSHWVYCLAVSPDQNWLVSGSEDKSVKVWSLNERSEKFSLKGHSHTITCVAVTSDNKYIVSGSDSVLKVWAFATQSEVFTLPSHKGFVRCVATTSNRKFIVSAGDDSLAKVWDISDKAEIKKFEAHSATVTSLTCNSEILVSGSEDKTWKLWDLTSGELLFTFQGHKDRIFSVVLSKDSQTVASSSADRTIKLWNLQTKAEKTLSGFEGWIRCVLWQGTTKGRNKKEMYAGCDDHLVYVANVLDCEIVCKLAGHTNAVYCLAKSSKTLFSGSADKNIIAWDLKSKTLLYTLKGHSGTVTGLTLDRTGKRLVSCSADFTVKVWSLSQHREEFSILGSEKAFTSITLQIHSGLVLTSSEDGALKAWNIEEKREEYSIPTSSALTYLSVSGNLVLTASVDKSIKAWDLGQGVNEALVALPFQSNFDFTAAVCGFNSTPACLNSQQASLPIGPHLFTLAHLFAHQGKEEQLEVVLASGPSVRTDNFSKSPLFYSLNKQSQLCTDLLLQYLIKLSSDSQTYLNTAFAIRGDLIKLLYNSSTVLEDFLNSLLISQVKCFAQPSEKLAIVKRSSIQKVFPADFTFERSSEAGKTKVNTELLLQFKTTGFELPQVLGSEESLGFLKALLACSNKKIFQSTLVQYYVRSKWNELWNSAFIYTLLIWLNLVVILLFVATNSFDFWLQLNFIIINCLLLVAEFIQLGNSGFYEYFSSYWNWVDMLRLLLCGVWIALKYANGSIEILTWSMIFVNFMKGVTGFRAFDRTRFYVRLFFRSFKDISYFLIIFFYSTLGFGLLFASNKNLTTEELINYLWLSPFDLNLGSFDSNRSLGLDYLGFFLASIVNVIVLLSLLISILGDSFDRFRLEAVEIDHIEMAEAVYELENLFFWNKRKSKSSYLQICDTIQMSYGNDDWEGSAKAIETGVAKSFDKRLRPIEENLQTTDAKLSKNILALENVFNANVERLEKKIGDLDQKMNLILQIINK